MEVYSAAEKRQSAGPTLAADITALREALTEVDKPLRRATRDDLAFVRTVAERIAPIRKRLPVGSEVRLALFFLVPTTGWWRNKNAVRRAWTFVLNAMNLEAPEGRWEGIQR